MSRIKSVFIPLLLFLFAFAIRLAFISKGPYHYDALELAITGQKTLDMLRLHYMHIPGSPLTVIIAAINIAIFRLFSLNDPVFAVNFMAVYFSSLCVVLLYSVARKLLDELTAAFSALFLMVFPPFLAVSLYGKDTSLALFFALLAILLLLKYFASGDKKLLITSGLSLGLCGSVRLAETLIMIPVALFIALHFAPYKDNWRAKIKSFCKIYALYFGAFLAPLLIFYLPYFWKTGINYVIDSGVRNINLAQFMGISSPILPLAIEYTVSSFSPLGAILSLCGLYLVFLKHRKASYFLFTWFLVLFFYYGNISTMEPRHLVIALVPMIMTTGYLFSVFAKKNKLLRILSLSVFSLMFAGLFYSTLPAITFRHQNNLQKDFALWVADHTEENAVIVALDENIFINYYGKRRVLGIPEVPITCNYKVIRRFLSDYLDRYLSEGTPVYFTTVGFAYDLNSCKTMTESLFKLYRVEPIGCKINENWHRACLELILFKDCLFRIEKK